MFPKALNLEHDFLGRPWVHPLKQQHILEMIEDVKHNYSGVTSLAIFGSTVKDRCRVDSDIDVLVFGDEDNLFCPPDNDEYDVHHARNIARDSHFWKALCEEAVVVYVAPVNGSCSG